MSYTTTKNIQMTEKRSRLFLQNFKKDIRLSGISSVYFIRSAWENLEWNNGRISWRFLGYRFIFLCYFLFCLSQSIHRDKDRHLWLIWATNISVVTQTVYGLVYFSNLSYRFAQNRRKRPIEQLPRMNIFDSVTWLLLNLAGTLPFVVTMGFWMFVSPEKKMKEGRHLAWYLTDHGGNSLFAFIDILIIAIPIRVAGAVYTVSAAILYVIFSALYEFAGGTYINEEEPYIYILLNWRQQPGWAVVNCVIATFTAFLFQIAMWLLFKLRIKLISIFKQQEGPNANPISTPLDENMQALCDNSTRVV